MTDEQLADKVVQLLNGRVRRGRSMNPPYTFMLYSIPGVGYFRAEALVLDGRVVVALMERCGSLSINSGQVIVVPVDGVRRLSIADTGESCGHRKRDMDDSYGGCICCQALRTINGEDDEAERLEAENKRHYTILCEIGDCGNVPEYLYIEDGLYLCAEHVPLDERDG